MLTDRKILITGATSGIGLALARRLGAQGNRLVLTGRRTALLDAAVADLPGATGIASDIADPQSIQALAATLAQDHPDLSMAILNAGIMVPERLGTRPTDLAISESIVATNLLGPIRLTHALMPLLLAQPRAAVVTVSSGLAFLPLAATPSYSATKAAIHSWTQSLRYQLKDTAVSVHELAPPAVQTDLMPGQATSPHAMPLADFIDEVMSMLNADPIPAEILVQRVGFLRRAEAEGRYDQTFTTLNDTYRSLD